MHDPLLIMDQTGLENAHRLGARAGLVGVSVHLVSPILLTALAAILTCLPLTLDSVWAVLAVTLLGMTLVNPANTLDLRALYALLLRVANARSKAV